VKDEAHTDGARGAELLTARQLASVLQVSESTVRRLAQKGRLPAIRITPHIIRFHLPTVMDALDGTHRQRNARRHPDDVIDDSQPTLPGLF
jgi:excisionase family DNA binding protein